MNFRAAEKYTTRIIHKGGNTVYYHSLSLSAGWVFCVCVADCSVYNNIRWLRERNYIQIRVGSRGFTTTTRTSKAKQQRERERDFFESIKRAERRAACYEMRIVAALCVCVCVYYLRSGWHSYVVVVVGPRIYCAVYTI